MPITYDITKDGLYLEGIKEGIQQERKKRNVEIAETLLKRGMLAVEVSEISTLSVEEVIKMEKRLELNNK